jgi:hypothetical protein
LPKIDEPLKSHSHVAKPEQHAGELEETEWCDDGSLGYVAGRHRDLQVALAEVQLTKNAAPI